MTDRKKPGVAFWGAVVVVVVLAGYPLSIGPVWWLLNQSWCPDWMLTAYDATYVPIFWLERNYTLAENILLQYSRFWVH